MGKLETNDRFERIAVSLTLRGGLVFSLLLFAIGTCLKIKTGDGSAGGIPLDVLLHSGSGDSLALGDRFLGYGVLMLALTPALRAILLLGIWIRERDWRFVVVALVVIATLGLSLTLGVG